MQVVKGLSIAAVIALSGCATAPAVFTEFAESSPDIDRLYVLNDVLIVDDVKGPHDKVDVSENRQLLELVSTEITGVMESKGYSVEPGSIDSIGMAAGDSRFLVYRGDEASKSGWDSDQTEAGSPPFHFGDGGAGRFDAGKVRLLHQGLHAAKGLKELKGKRFKDAVVFDLPPNSAILVTQSEGRRVSSTKKGGQVLLSTFLTMGAFIAWEPSKVIHRLYLISPETGEVLWANAFAADDMNVDAQSVRKAIERAFKSLPDKAVRHAKAP